MPNGAIYLLESSVEGSWNLTADTRAMREVAAVRSFVTATSR
jgi:hypothetical protein